MHGEKVRSEIKNQKGEKERLWGDQTLVRIGEKWKNECLNSFESHVNIWTKFPSKLIARFATNLVKLIMRFAIDLGETNYKSSNRFQLWV